MRVYGDVLEEVLEPLLQGGPVLSPERRKSVGQLGDEVPDGGSPGQDVGIEGLALLGPHFLQGLQGPIDDRRHFIPEPSHVLLSLFHTYQIAKLEKGGEIHIAGDPVVGLHLAEEANQICYKRLISNHLAALPIEGGDGADDIEASSAESPTDELADTVLESHVAARQADGHIQVAVVDGIDLHRHLTRLRLSFGAAEARHATHHAW